MRRRRNLWNTPRGSLKKNYWTSAWKSKWRRFIPARSLRALKFSRRPESKARRLSDWCATLRARFRSPAFACWKPSPENHAWDWKFPIRGAKPCIWRKCCRRKNTPSRKARLCSRSARIFPAGLSSPICPKCRICLSPEQRGRANPFLLMRC